MKQHKILLLFLLALSCFPACRNPSDGEVRSVRSLGNRSSKLNSKSIATAAEPAEVVSLPNAGETDSPGVQPKSLLNSSFEDGILGTRTLDQWNPFGENVYQLDLSARSKKAHLSLSGNSPSSKKTNFSGVYQSLPAETGQRWFASAFVMHPSANMLEGDNRARIELVFVDSAGATLPGGQHLSKSLTSASSPDTYVALTVAGTAPENTVEVRVVPLFEQQNNAGGAAFFDDVYLVQSSNEAPRIETASSLEVSLPQELLYLEAWVVDDDLPYGKTLSASWSVLSAPENVDPESIRFEKASADELISSGSGPVVSETHIGPTHEGAGPPILVMSRFAVVTVPGRYVFELSADDGELRATKKVTVNVVQPNQPPTVEAGAFRVLVLPEQELKLRAQVQDDGVSSGPLTARWSQVEGPAASVFENVSVIDTVVRFPSAGSYVLRLTADDGEAAGFDDLKVVVRGSLGPKSGTLFQPPQGHCIDELRLRDEHGVELKDVLAMQTRAETFVNDLLTDLTRYEFGYRPSNYRYPYSLVVEEYGDTPEPGYAYGRVETTDPDWDPSKFKIERYATTDLPYQVSVRYREFPGLGSPEEPSDQTVEQDYAPVNVADLTVVHRAVEVNEAPFWSWHARANGLGGLERLGLNAGNTALTRTDEGFRASPFFVWGNSDYIIRKYLMGDVMYGIPLNYYPRSWRGRPGASLVRREDGAFMAFTHPVGERQGGTTIYRGKKNHWYFPTARTGVPVFLLKNRETGEIVDAAFKPTGLLVSYEVPQDSPLHFYLGYRTYSYDQAMGIIGGMKRLPESVVTRWVRGLLRMAVYTEYEEGRYWLRFPFSASSISGVSVDPYYRTGAQMWAFYALAFFLKNYPDSEIKEQVLDALELGLDTMVALHMEGNRGLQEGLFRGGRGWYGRTPGRLPIEYGGGTETELDENGNPVKFFHEDYQIKWVSAEHNFDAYFAYRLSAKVLDQQGRDGRRFLEVSNTVRSRMLAHMWSPELGRFNQGIASPELVDNAGALDINSWGSLMLRDIGAHKLARQALVGADAFVVHDEERGETGYTAYIPEQGYAFAKRIAWGEGTAGVASARCARVPREPFQLARCLDEFSMLMGLYQKGKGVLYVDETYLEYELQPWRSVASTAWSVIAGEANGMWGAERGVIENLNALPTSLCASDVVDPSESIEPSVPPRILGLFPNPDQTVAGVNENLELTAVFGASEQSTVELFDEEGTDLSPKADIQAHSIRYSITSTVSRSYRFHLVVTSASGQSSAQEIRFSVDGRAPIVSANVAGGPITGPFHVELTADGPSTIYYSLNGDLPWEGLGSTYKGEAPLTDILIEGTTTLQFFAVDHAGNRSEVIRHDYLLTDTEAEKDRIEAYAEHDPVSGSIRIAWNQNATSSEAYHVYRSASPQDAAHLREKAVLHSAPPVRLRVTSEPTSALVLEDKNILPGSSYTYGVTWVDTNGREHFGSVTAPVTVPLDMVLGQNLAPTTAALAWLQAAQHPQGFWGEDHGSRLLTTIQVLNAFYVAGYDGPGVRQALYWVYAQPAKDHDLLARKIYVLRRWGLDTARLRTKLLSGATIKGSIVKGFGLSRRYSPDTVTTALAALALSPEGEGGAPSPARSLFQDDRFRGVDGHYSWMPGLRSAVYTTALVQEALAQYGLLEPSHAAWVQSQQEASGLIAGNLIDTAAALLWSSLEPESKGRARRYLRQQQDRDGSWAQDSYHTALFLEALLADAPTRGGRP